MVTTYKKWIEQQVAKRSLEIFKMATSYHLGFDPAGNSDIRSAVPKIPTPESNMKTIG